MKYKMNVPSLKGPNRHKLIARYVEDTAATANEQWLTQYALIYIISQRVSQTHHFSLGILNVTKKS